MQVLLHHTNQPEINVLKRNDLHMQILYYVPVPGLYWAAAASIGPVQVRYGQRSVEDWPVGSLYA